MKKDMPLEGLRWSRDSGSALYDTPQNGRSRTGWGGCVLDNCMGSGTTAIACIREKRNFIGFELNKEYYDKACKRIQLEMAQPSLF